MIVVIAHIKRTKSIIDLPIVVDQLHCVICITETETTLHSHSELT